MSPRDRGEAGQWKVMRERVEQDGGEEGEQERNGGSMGKQKGVEGGSGVKTICFIRAIWK